MRGRHREGKQRRGQAHPLPEHPSEEGSGRLDLLVGFGHQLHGLLLFAGVVHREPGLPLAERREENGPMFRSGRRGARRGDEGDVSSAGDAAGLFFYGEKGKVISASLSPSAGQRRNGNGREKNGFTFV